MPEPTPWRDGAFRFTKSGLQFGKTYEDPEIELAVFPPRARVFCIAGAGCTALRLAAAGHRVTAVDINAAQVEYVRSRVLGEGPREGMVERLMGWGRSLWALTGWSQGSIREFLSLDDPVGQVLAWDRRLDTRRFRAAATLLSPRWLRLAYARPFPAALPADFGARLRARLRRGWATHANRRNPYAWRLLLGEETVEPETGRPVELACADAAEFLEQCPPASFDAFSLSNIADGASAAYTKRLREAVRSAASPGAISVLRSFGEPATTDAAQWAARDRALLWGSIEVRQILEDRVCSIN